jgi:mono/diheme cytochrome c family protein
MRTFCLLIFAGLSLLSGQGILDRAPADKAARENPYDDQREARRAGEKMFRRYCASCHGESAIGSSRAPSLRIPAVVQAQPGVLEWVIENGALEGGMPSWSKLPPQQRWQIVTYLKSLLDPE